MQRIDGLVTMPSSAAGEAMEGASASEGSNCVFALLDAPTTSPPYWFGDAVLINSMEHQHKRVVFPTNNAPQAATGPSSPAGQWHETTQPCQQPGAGP